MAVTRALGALLVVSLLPSAAWAQTPAGRAPGGPWRPPLERLAVLERFDPPQERWLAGHRGVDLAAAPGQEVRAAGGGTVTFAAVLADRPVVVVDHGPIRTTYEPVAAGVAAGDVVVAGQPIGTIAAGAHCSARCLHWGARIGETYVDPLALLTPYRPVLKPPR